MVYMERCPHCKTRHHPYFYCLTPGSIRLVNSKKKWPGFLSGNSPQGGTIMATPATGTEKTKSEKVTLNCNLNPDVARKFKALCILTGKKVPEVLEDVINEYVKKSGKVTL